MNAPNPTGGDREFDALRRAQRAHEPSMEEILASIRAIIADDRPTEPAKPVSTAAKPVSNAGPQIVYSKDSALAARAFPELDPISPRSQSPPPLPPPVAETPAVPWRRSPIEALPARKPEPDAEAPVQPLPRSRLEPMPTPPETAPPPAAPTEPPMLSEAADRAVSESFHALSASLAFRSEEIESLTREILRPMIKTWLDEHLPSLVERLVRAEIQRVARGGR